MAEHSRPAGMHGFRRALVVTLVSLALLCAVFAVLGYLQGPRLSSARVDTGAVTTQADQQLRLFTNQAVADVDARDVTVTPAAPFTVSTAAGVITVQFTGRLDSETRYDVEVVGVTSPFEDIESTLRYGFTTAAASLYYLDRADPTRASSELGGVAPQDQIVRTNATGGDRVSVVRATAIQSFAVVGRLVAVATLIDNRSSALTLVDPVDGATETIELPAAGTIDLLRGSDSAGILTFTLTSLDAIDGGARYEQTLFSVDLLGDHRVTPVTGLGAGEIEILGYQYIPGTGRIIAQTIDMALLDIDLGGSRAALPLGTYASIGRISADGTRLVVENIFGQFALDLADGKETRLDIAPINGIVPFGGDIQLLASSSARIQQVAVFDDATGRFSSHIVFQDGSSSRIIYEKTDQKGSIDTFEVSPNGQYIAVTTVPDVAASILDGYVVEPKANTITTSFIDVATGRIFGTVEGFDVYWAAG